MKLWPVKTLGDLCEVRIGRTPSRDEPRFWGGSFVWATIRDLSSDNITFSKEMISEAAVRECMPEPVPAGTLLFSFKLTIGRMAVAGCPLYTNEAIAALPIRNPSELSRDFLRYVLMAGSHEGTADAAVLGKVLNKEKVRQLPIPVPPLAEQERIVKLLDEADALRKLRAQADRRTAALLPALFDELFGDPLENPKGWERQPVSSFVSELFGGRSVTPAGADETSGRFRVLKISAVTSGDFRPEESKPVPADYEPPASHFVRTGDMLFSRANTTELVGATACVFDTPPNLLLPDKLWRFVWKEPRTVEPLYVWSVFQSASIRRELGQRATGTGGSMKNISKPKVMTLSIPVPPLPLQQAFARRTSEVRELQAAQAARHRQLDALFQSMLHRAFNGELS